MSIEPEDNEECAGEEPSNNLDGDAATALASAGLGTDEDYEHNLFDENRLEN